MGIPSAGSSPAGEVVGAAGISGVSVPAGVVTGSAKSAKVLK